MKNDTFFFVMTQEFPDKSDCISIGSIIRTHGGDGQVIVSIYEINPDDFENLEYVFLEIQEKFVPFYIESCKIKKNSAYVYFQDVNSVLKAEKICSYKMYILREFLISEEDEIEHETLNCTVFDGETKIGIVTGIIEYPLNSVLQVTDDKNKEILLPYSHELIIKFDINEKIIIMNLPLGLLDLQ